MIRRYSKKGLEKRKEERACLPEFFQRHIEIAKGMCCANCGERLIGDVSEVAHRLPKNLFKSVMCDDDNVTYLCSWKSNNNCHGLYDGSNEQLQALSIFSAEKEIIKELLERVTETVNYKIYDKWQL